MAEKTKIAALPVNDKGAALDKSKIELQKYALARGQQILARAESATGSTDALIDAEVTKAAADIANRAAELKSARASGEIDPNAP